MTTILTILITAFLTILFQRMAKKAFSFIREMKFRNTFEEWTYDVITKEDAAMFLLEDE